MAAALADSLSQCLLRVVELVHEAPVAKSLIQGREVLPLKVLNECDLKGLLVRKFLDDHRDIVDLSHLGGTPAPFTRDDLIFFRLAWIRADQKGLKDSFRTDGIHEVTESINVYFAARLVLSGMEQFDRKCGWPSVSGTLGCWGDRCVLAKECIEAAAEMSSRGRVVVLALSRRFVRRTHARITFSRLMTSLARWR